MSNVEIKTTEEAIKIFEDESINHGLFTENGDSKKANESYFLINKSASFLHNQKSLDLLLSLLENDNLSVRLWSAYYLLDTNNKDKALDVISKISKGSGIVSFNAEMTLKEYNKGNLKIIYEN